MALVPTIETELGFQAPAFKLPDTVSGKMITVEEIAGEKATVVMFICNHCPYVKHVLEELVRLGNDYIPHGVSFAAISANDVLNYPEDAPEKMKALALSKEFPFAYLYDETQEVARAYHAACTPDFNIFDSQLKCVYRGQLDDSRPGNELPVTGRDIRQALDQLIAGKKVSALQRPSIGCSIKWKS